MRDPNNTRNRYRRMCEARRAYGFTVPTLREWIRGARPDSYSALPHHLNFTVRIGRRHVQP
jgi:hypothetical protein